MKYHHPTEIPLSKTLFFEWISDRIPCASVNVRGDSYPITWAADDTMYVGTGDPNWAVKDHANYVANPQKNGWAESWELYTAMSGVAFEKITGEPEHFQIERVNDMPGFIGPGGAGTKPAGVISVNGRIYMAVQNLLGEKPPHIGEKSQHGSDATIIWSDDYGKTWTPKLDDILLSFEKEQYEHVGGYGYWKTPPEERTEYKGWKPMFPGCLFGGPSFIQFGRDNADAVDQYVYAISGDQWDNGSQIRLSRVHQDHVMERERWEFAVVDEHHDVTWTSELENATPILEVDRHLGMPEMVYVKSLQKYILLTWALRTDFRTLTGSELTILEADRPWGPFSLVHYDWMWYKRECCPYTPKLPLKWFDQQNLEGYILHSGNWETQIPYYLPQIRKFRFTVRTDDCR